MSLVECQFLKGPASSDVSNIFLPRSFKDLKNMINSKYQYAIHISDSPIVTIACDFTVNQLEFSCRIHSDEDYKKLCSDINSYQGTNVIFYLIIKLLFIVRNKNNNKSEVVDLGKHY